MDRPTAEALLVIAAIAVLAPLVSAVSGGRIPGVVIEIACGIAIGPQVLRLATATPTVSAISDLGLAFLFFSAGYEMDLDRVRGRPLRLAALGWVASLSLGLAVAAVAVAEGFAISVVLIGLALTTTAIGTLVPMLADADELPTPFGAHILAIGAAGEFLPIVAVTLLASERGTLADAAVLVGFALLAVAAAGIALRPRPPRLGRLLGATLHKSSQLPVRIAVLVVIALAFVASRLGLDALLGAFAAGLVIRLANRGSESEVVASKLDAISGGVFIPVFFVVTGMRFDLDALTSDPAAALRIPVFLAAFLVVRGLPILGFLRRDLGPTDRRAAALLGSTALPLVVAITTLGLDTGRMLPENAAALVAAGMLSVLCFPAIGLALRRHSRQPTAPV